MKSYYLQIILAFFAGWVNRSQQALIDYQKTENEISREKLGKKRIRFTDDQRRRLAVKANALGRKTLLGMECIVTPDTLMRYRHIATKLYAKHR